MRRGEGQVKIRRVKNQTPQSSPPSMADGGRTEGESFVWEVLAPRLLNPGVLSIINTLLEKGEPLSLRDIAGAVELTTEHARYHCQTMERRGVLEVQLVPRAEGDGNEPFYFFAKPPQAVAPSPSSSAPSTSA
jgi:hypothetical protein